MSFSSAGIDAVLQAPPPPFSAAQACEIGRAAFGIEALSARSLGSERDQAFLLAGASGAGTAVLKGSNPAWPTAPRRAPQPSPHVPGARPLVWPENVTPRPTKGRCSPLQLPPPPPR